MFQEPSRNAACPCESGRKFKYCCLINLDPKKIHSFVTLKETRHIEEAQIQDGDRQRFFEISLKMNNGGKDFKNYLKELIRIRDHNPKEARIYNLITVCYGGLGKQEKAIEMVKETFKLFPDYLFARTSMMRFHLIKNEHKKHLEIFKNKFDLQGLYPERNKFHISEALDFYSITGIYFARENKFYLARQCLKILVSLHPNSNLIQELDNELYKQLQTYQVNQ